MKKLVNLFENVSMFSYLKTVVRQYMLVLRMHFI